MASRRDEVERLRAQLEEMTAELERARQHIAAQEELGAMFAALPATAGGETGPLPRVQRQQSHRVPKEQRWLRVVPGILLPSGLGGGLRAAGAAFKAHRVVSVKLATAGVAAGALTVTLGASRHLEFDTPLGIHWSPSVPGAATDPDATPMPSGSVQLIASTVHAPVKPRVTPTTGSTASSAAPIPAPVVTPPPPTQNTPAPDTSWSASGTSDPSSQTSDPSQTSQPSDWQAQGDHAAEDSAPGDSGYRPRHGVNDSGSNYWQGGGQQSDHGQSDTRQGDTGRSADWQSGNQQSGTWQGGQQGGQQQNGGWQQDGGQQRNHGGR